MERGYADMEVGNLQLIMGAIKKKEDFVGDSELCKPTPAYYRHTEIINTIKEEIPSYSMHAHQDGRIHVPLDKLIKIMEG